VTSAQVWDVVGVGMGGVCTWPVSGKSWWEVMCERVSRSRDTPVNSFLKLENVSNIIFPLLHGFSYGQLWSKNIKWKMAETGNSEV
jgi:hypothetical protein